MRSARRKMFKFFVALICTGILWLPGADFSWVPEASGQNIFQAYTKLQAAPDFSIQDLQGKEVNFRDYRGQVILLNFWNTW